MKPIGPKSTASKNSGAQRQNTGSQVTNPAKGVKGNDQKSQFSKTIEWITNHVFDYKDDSRDVEQKNQRLKHFTDISEMLTVQSNVINIVIPNLDAVMKMIQSQIFRPLPVVKKAGPSEDMGGLEEEQLSDPSWPHLQPVYEFFLQLIVNDAADVRSLKAYISHKFIQEFLELFDSEEITEREYLKNILHRLYAKLVPRRKMIRKAVTDTFYTLIHENYKFNGAAELLDIFASIISGFAVPLRDEHVYFFKTVIIPLHKVQTCPKFHNELLRCSMLFVSKDPLLAFNLIEGLLKYWPFASFGKETLFLAELLEVMDVCDMTKLEPHIEKLFERLVKCIASPHLQVSDRAMCFFENDFFLSILRHYKSKIFPILVPVIAKLAETHWHKLLQDSLGALKNIMRDVDPNLYEKNVDSNNSKYIYLVKDPTELQKDRKKCEEDWDTFEKKARTIDPNLRVSCPYNEKHIVGKHNGLDNGNCVVIE